MSVLLVFGGSVGEGDDLAEELTRKHKISVFLLEFGDWPRIQQFDGARVKRKQVRPAAFLKSYGVIPPGYELEYLPAPPITVIGVLEDVTLDQARRAMPKKKESFSACARGVLVNDVSGITTLKLSRKLKRRTFTLFYDREDDTFGCLVWRPDQQDEVCFSVGEPWFADLPADPQFLIDSIKRRAFGTRAVFLGSHEAQLGALGALALETVVIRVPALASRRHELSRVVTDAVAEQAGTQGASAAILTAHDYELLLAHDWPRNHDEVAEVVERLTALRMHRKVRQAARALGMSPGSLSEWTRKYGFRIERGAGGRRPPAGA